MAGELVSFGIKKLWDLLSQESELFQGIEDQVNGLKDDVKLLSSFLEDAYAKKHTTATVRNAVKKIQEIVYDAEDMMETYLLKEKIGKTSGIRTSIRRLACSVPDRRRNALDIGGIRKRISDVIRDMQSFGVQQAIADGGYIQPIGDTQRAIRQAFPNEYESDFVGLEENVIKLVGYFVEKDDVQVVSITGMGGLGKTTLARQVFNNEMVKTKFDRLAWVCVSQEFTRISVWQTILQSLTSKGKKDEILKMKEDELQDELFQLLETSKSFIVFDDIWKNEDWDLIKPIFPPNKKGWKVLLTSRNDSVAVGPKESYINLKPECLTTEESWTLFQKIAHPINDTSELKINEEMEEMGKEMVKHCGGLPLAIKVLGGMLTVKYTLHYWKGVSKNIRSHLVGGRNDINDDKSSLFNYILSLSFEELPISLKNCFLYLAHFPEDHKIDVEDLSYYWAADGILEPRDYDGETIRDVGDSYIEELVRRNMVISERDVTTLRSETCHLHDMMREICLTKAKEDNFLQIASNGASPSNFQSRRFVSRDPTTLHVERDISNPKLRSLVVMVEYSFGEEWKLSGSSFKRLELLRVLDLFKANFRGGKLPSGIGKLIHLRYLSLKDALVSHLPPCLGNLLLLIYLNLDIDLMVPIFVPNVFMGMQELRYLELPERMKRKTKLELKNLVKLEALKNFSTENSNLEDLRGMVKLKTLHINFAKETSIETLSASIGGLRHLEHLKITDVRGSNQKLEEGIVLDFSRLTRLRLSMYMPNLLKKQHFSSHLTIISLRSCDFEDDPMPILEKLLQLKEVHLDWGSFSGRRMVCSGGGFTQLQKLMFWGLKEWEEWIVEEGSMPLLHTLEIWSCEKLKELPDGLRFITSLKEMNIYIEHLEFKEKLSKGGEDFYKVQHIPHVRIV